MILDKNITIKVNSTSLKHYKNLGYDVKMGESININPIHLTESSFYEINVKCDVCGEEKNIKFHNYNKNIKNTGIYCCSNKCAHKVKNKKTCLEKYGDENYNNIEKTKKTNIEKYGCENVFQNENIKNKIKENNLEKFGFESHNKNELVKQNKKKTFLEKYGVDCNLNTEEQKEETRNIKLEKFGNLNNYDKLKNTFIEKYGVEHPSMVEEFQEKKINNYKKTIKDKILIKYEKFGIISANFDDDKFIFNCTNHTFEINRNLLKNRVRCNTKLCTICNPIGKHISGLEVLFSDYLKEIYNKNIIFNSKDIIFPYELDIYLPELKLAFEFNGLFWHNELHRSKIYHKNKTELCEKEGIKLIQIYEDDWIYKQDIIKSRILNLLGKSEKIYARKCNIKELDSKITEKFLDENHLQGNINSKIKIGLFYNNELISLITFGSLRKSMGQKTIEGNYELLRFCNKLNMTVIGGASRLFKFFVDKYKPNEITSYADRSWSSGNLYKQLKFEFVHNTAPNYYYILDGIRKHRFGFRKDKLVKEGYDINKTEHEIMFDRETYRIYDSGSLKFIWKNKLCN